MFRWHESFSSLLIIEMNVLLSIIIQRLIVIRKKMNEVRKLIVTCQLNDALNIRNNLFSILIHNLSLNFDVFVYRERNDNQSKSWKDSFKLLNVKNDLMIIKLSSDSTKFWSTMMKSYYDDDHFENSSLFISIIDSSFIVIFRNHWICFNQMINTLFRTIKNQKLKSSRTHLNVIAIDFENISHRLHFLVLCLMRLSISLSLRFRYSLSSLNSIQSYTSHFLNSSHLDKRDQRTHWKNVFQSINKNDVSTNVHIFNFRFVNEIKHLDIDEKFEKSRLVMQTFNDQNKN
jgi:hypothetical protein